MIIAIGEANGPDRFHRQFGPIPDGRKATATRRRRPVRRVSGGTKPTTLRREAIAVMQEMGIDISPPPILFLAPATVTA